MKNFTGIHKGKYGDIRYYKDGKLHREGGPAIIYNNGDREWYFNGKLHREDGPAIEYSNRVEKWYFKGKLHRLDGPAIIRYKPHNKIYKTEWYQNGKLHRLDGPAIDSDTQKQFYINGKLLLKKSFIKNNKFYYYSSFKDGKFTYKDANDGHKWKKYISHIDSTLKINNKYCNDDIIKNIIDKYFILNKYTCFKCEYCSLLLFFSYDIDFNTNNILYMNEPFYLNENGELIDIASNKILMCSDYIIQNILQ